MTRFKSLVAEHFSAWIALCGLLVAAGPARAQNDGSAEARAVRAVCDKQVVVLGELPSHGEGRTFQAKARIVEMLVEQCGFEALYFEAPFYDFLGFQEAVARGNARPPQLDKAIGGFWMTRGLSTWRRWLFDQATDGELVLGGLDDQPSATSEYARATLPGLVAASLPAQDAPECEEAVTRNLFWRYNAMQEFDAAEQALLHQCTRLATDTPEARGGHASVTPEQMMVENLAGYYERQQGSPEAQDRDVVMYRNFLWHRTHMREARKHIIWTATVHAARQQGEGEHKPLGAWLAEEWGERLAVIGFSAFTGQSSTAGMPIRPLPQAPPGSLEALATERDTAWFYVDTASLRALGTAPSRLFGRFTSADWSNYFDGVLVIRQEVAPAFEQQQ